MSRARKLLASRTTREIVVIIVIFGVIFGAVETVIRLLPPDSMTFIETSPVGDGYVHYFSSQDTHVVAAWYHYVNSHPPSDSAFCGTALGQGLNIATHCHVHLHLRWYRP